MTGAIVGTPHYMAPEQVQGLAVDGRADQFSLAVIAFEMLTGEKPFTGEQLTTVVYKIVAEEPVPAHRLNSTLNQQITNVLRRALAKKPDARYPNCQKFVDALEAACAAAKGWKAAAARRRPQSAHRRRSAPSRPTSLCPVPPRKPSPAAPQDGNPAGAFRHPGGGRSGGH
jgi:serine/threonine protein kinase